MAAALYEETRIWRYRVLFRNTITEIVVGFPPAPRPEHDPRLAPARISVNANHFRRLSDGELSLDHSDNVPFECPLTELLPLSPDTGRDIRSSLLTAMLDPQPDVVNYLEFVLSKEANVAAEEAVREGTDGFNLVAEINSFDFRHDLHLINQLINLGIISEEVDSIIFAVENEDEDEDENEDGGGESTAMAREVASSLLSRMSMVEFGKDCRSADGECCSICLVEFEAGMRLKKMECSHLFHDDCLLSWLQRKAFCPSCPVCRADVAAN